MLATARGNMRQPLVFVVVSCCLLCLAAGTPADAVSGYISTSVLNMTFTGAGTGWPTTTAELAPASNAVTSAVCAELPSTVTACSAFLIAVSTGTVALQLSVETDIASNASSVYTTLYAWSINTGSPPTALIQTAAQSALGVGLSTLAYESGAYSMPCRGQGVYSFLPVCAASEGTSNTTFYIKRSSGGAGDAQTAIQNYLCAMQSSCTAASVTVSQTSNNDGFSEVVITGAALGLEAVLNYVATTRTAFTTAQTDILAIQMRSGSMMANLFSVNETNRYDEVYPITLQCAPATGMWAIALIAIIPIALILFRYIWYRGRKHAKKVGRKRITEDEQRIMQGYTTTPATGATTAADPPPGVDASAFFNARQPQSAAAQQTGTAATGAQSDAQDQQWVMDDQGNYYLMDAGQQSPTPSPAQQTTAAAAADDQGQQWVMDDQGNYYMMDATDAAAGAASTVSGNASPSSPAVANVNSAAGVDSVEMEQMEPTENSISYQTYVDPNTGEVYQYVVDPQAVEEGGEQDQAGAAVDAAASAGAEYVEEPQEAVADDAQAEQSSSQYVQYVDPNTGETYYYDPNAVQDESAA